MCLCVCVRVYPSFRGGGGHPTSEDPDWRRLVSSSSRPAASFIHPFVIDVLRPSLFICLFVCGSRSRFGLSQGSAGFGPGGRCGVIMPGAMESASGPFLVMPHGAVSGIMDWWNWVDSSVLWQERIWLGLAIAYSLMSVIALVRGLLTLICSYVVGSLSIDRRWEGFRCTHVDVVVFAGLCRPDVGSFKVISKIACDPTCELLFSFSRTTLHLDTRCSWNSWIRLTFLGS